MASRASAQSSLRAHKTAGVVALEFDANLLPTALQFQQKWTEFAEASLTLQTHHRFADTVKLAKPGTISAKWPSQLGSLLLGHLWPEIKGNEQADMAAQAAAGLAQADIQNCMDNDAVEDYANDEKKDSTCQDAFRKCLLDKTWTAQPPTSSPSASLSAIIRSSSKKIQNQRRNPWRNGKQASNLRRIEKRDLVDTYSSYTSIYSSKSLPS